MFVEIRVNVFQDDTLSRLAYNGMAAWRSGGIYALPFKSALPPPLRQTARWLLCIFVHNLLFIMYYKYQSCT
jgi:hypothetical protein